VMTMTFPSMFMLLSTLMGFSSEGAPRRRGNAAAGGRPCQEETDVLAAARRGLRHRRATAMARR
jgi:hypothetical protein